jgi:polar amino acid transport system permease protein
VQIFPSGTGWLWFLLNGGLLTIEISLLSLIIAAIVGAIVGIGLASGRRSLAWPSRIYVDAVRSLPILLLMFFVYYVPSELFGVDLGALPTGVCVLGLYGGAFMAEVVRMGVSSIGRAQWDAAYSIGLTPLQALLHVIAPQSLRVMAAPAAGIFISNVKDSSVASIIGLTELTGAAQAIRNANFGEGSVGVLSIIALAYFLLCFGLSNLSRQLERRWSV